MAQIAETQRTEAGWIPKTKVGRMVQAGQVVSLNDPDSTNGDNPFPVNSTSIGRRIGSWLSGTGTVPHFSQ